MNSNPTTPASTVTSGRRYWRSLDELADTPEFKEWLHREFPQGASEMEEGSSRRHFLKLMSASFALAGVATLGGGMLAGLASHLERKYPKWVASYIGLALVVSLYYAPVWGEFALSTAAAHHRLWFATWRP